MEQTQLVNKLIAICGARAVQHGSDIDAALLADWGGDIRGSARAVVFPQNTQEVSQVVALCNEHGIGITPQGGNTGLSGGATPSDTVLLCMKKLNRIRDIDEEAGTITAEAGCLLENIHHAVTERGFYFPLTLGAKGSCQIGGNLATNAGGSNVLQYGNTRDSCLGIEAVFANGQVLRELTGLRKNNTGYDLRHLLIGSEGTLAVITAATFKLFTPPQITLTALLTPPTPAAAMTIMRRLQQRCTLVACEIMPAMLFEFYARYAPSLPLPYTDAAALPPWTVLIEAANAEREALESLLMQLYEEQLCGDIIIAENETQRANFWKIREDAAVITAARGSWMRSDVSLPLSRLAEFINTLQQRLTAVCDGAYMIGMGHLGDGNLHISIRPQDENPEEHPALTDTLQKIIYDYVRECGGSFSAEHGIGQLKIGALKTYKDAAAVSAMQALKRALDPNNIMNPGKLLPS